MKARPEVQTQDVGNIQTMLIQGTSLLTVSEIMSVTGRGREAKGEQSHLLEEQEIEKTVIIDDRALQKMNWSD